MSQSGHQKIGKGEREREEEGQHEQSAIKIM